MTEDKKIEYYRIIVSEPSEQNGESITHDLLETINDIHGSMIEFRKFVIEELTSIKREINTPKQKEDQHDRLVHLEKENKRLKDEIRTKEQVINKLMSGTDSSTKTNKPNEQSKGKPSPKPATKEKEYVEIVGDSMINGFEERGFCKNHRTKVRKPPGATSTDILDHIKPVLRRKPAKIIIHAGTNDITNGINYLKNVKTLVKMIGEESPSTKLCLSGVVKRFDIQSREHLVEDINKRLKNYCSQNKIDFIDNDNIGKKDLGIKKLHPNKKGLKILVNNFLKYLS